MLDRRLKHSGPIIFYSLLSCGNGTLTTTEILSIEKIQLTKPFLAYIVSLSLQLLLSGKS